jgi:hypothetical protein
VNGALQPSSATFYCGYNNFSKERSHTVTLPYCYFVWEHMGCFSIDRRYFVAPRCHWPLSSVADLNCLPQLQSKFLAIFLKESHRQRTLDCGPQNEGSSRRPDSKANVRPSLAKTKHVVRNWNLRHLLLRTLSKMESSNSPTGIYIWSQSLVQRNERLLPMALLISDWYRSLF